MDAVVQMPWYIQILPFLMWVVTIGIILFFIYLGVKILHYIKWKKKHDIEILDNLIEINKKLNKD